MPALRSVFRHAGVGLHKIKKIYPHEERFGLVADMRRSANSITHNIAEGYGRYESKDKTRFYAKHPLDKISRGSAYELISQILVSSALGYVYKVLELDIIKSNRNIIKELNALIKTVES